MGAGRAAAGAAASRAAEKCPAPQRPRTRAPSERPETAERRRAPGAETAERGRRGTGAEAGGGRPAARLWGRGRPNPGRAARAAEPPPPARPRPGGGLLQVPRGASQAGESPATWTQRGRLRALRVLGDPPPAAGSQLGTPGSAAARTPRRTAPAALPSLQAAARRGERPHPGRPSVQGWGQRAARLERGTEGRAFGGRGEARMYHKVQTRCISKPRRAQAAAAFTMTSQKARGRRARGIPSRCASRWRRPGRGSEGALPRRLPRDRPAAAAPPPVAATPAWNRRPGSQGAARAGGGPRSKKSRAPPDVLLLRPGPPGLPHFGGLRVLTGDPCT